MSITISQHPLMVACLSFSVLLSLTVTKHLISPGKGVKGRKDVGKDNDKEEVYVTNETYCLGAVVVTGNFWFLSPGLFGLFEKKNCRLTCGVCMFSVCLHVLFFFAAALTSTHSPKTYRLD